MKSAGFWLYLILMRCWLWYLNQHFHEFAVSSKHAVVFLYVQIAVLLVCAFITLGCGAGITVQGVFCFRRTINKCCRRLFPGPQVGCLVIETVKWCRYSLHAQTDTVGNLSYSCDCHVWRLHNMSDDRISCGFVVVLTFLCRINWILHLIHISALTWLAPNWFLAVMYQFPSHIYIAGCI